jgi:hypothetical protein
VKLDLEEIKSTFQKINSIQDRRGKDVVMMKEFQPADRTIDGSLTESPDGPPRGSETDQEIETDGIQQGTSWRTPKR